MSIDKLSPKLLKIQGASDGDVLTYVAANSSVEFKVASGGGGDVANAWVNANDYSTLLTARANDFNSYTTLTANDYNSFTTLTANIYNTFAYLNANVGGEVSQYAQKFTVDGSTNSFTLSNSVSSEESILVYLDGIVQHNDAYVVSGTTLTIANTLPLPTSTLGIRRLSSTSGSSTGGLSYLRTYALG